MRLAQRAQTILVLPVALAAVVCIFALLFSPTRPAAAAETHPAPQGAPPADNCTRSISIDSFTISTSKVAPGASFTATLVVRNTHWTNSYTHYYEVVLIDADGVGVSGTWHGLESTVDDGPGTSPNRDTFDDFTITVPTSTKDGNYRVRAYISTESGGNVCESETVTLQVKSPAPEPDPESCDGGSIQITQLTFPSSIQQGNAINGHIRVRNSSDQTWLLDVRVEILDPNQVQVFHHTWAPTLTTSTREFNQYPSWTTSTSNRIGTYSVHASARSGGEVCHATFAASNRNYTSIAAKTFAVTDGNPPPAPRLSRPSSGAEITDTTPTLIGVRSLTLKAAAWATISRCPPLVTSVPALQVSNLLIVPESHSPPPSRPAGITGGSGPGTRQETTPIGLRGPSR